MEKFKGLNYAEDHDYSKGQNGTFNPPTIPNPYNWKILDSWQYDLYLLVWINYPESIPIPFNGDKIMLYKNITLDMLIEQDKIDPAFANDSINYTPIVKFIPNIDGWTMGKKMIKLLTGKL